MLAMHEIKPVLVNLQVRIEIKEELMFDFIYKTTLVWTGLLKKIM